jgi:hypothetical protein
MEEVVKPAVVPTKAMLAAAVEKSTPRARPYSAEIVAFLIGSIVFFLFPKKEDEERLLVQYHAADRP